jgi:hypothetical protein
MRLVINFATLATKKETPGRESERFVKSTHHRADQPNQPQRPKGVKNDRTDKVRARRRAPLPALFSARPAVFDTP